MRRRSAVTLGWRWAQITALEHLGPHLGAAVTARWRRRAAAQARRVVRPLEHWEGIPEKSYRTYQADGNVVRIKRILDHLEPGERVLDIGIGFGYVGGVLLRDGRIAYYCGTDLKERLLDSARSMLAVNGLDHVPHHLEVLNVYDLTTGFVERHDPSVVLLLEVLEHLDDPVGALEKVVSSAPPGMRVVFTVPILGRLEGVWGHRWVFDARGLQSVCGEAGLAIEHVEPVHNVWTLVVARTDRRRLGERRRASSGRGVSRLPSLLWPGPRSRPVHSFSDLPTNRSAASYRRSGDTAQVALDPRRIGLRCSASVPEDAEAPGTAGVRLAIARPLLLRLELSVKPPEGVLAVYVTGHDRTGRRRLQWRWGGSGRRPSGRRMTHVLKQGRRSRMFAAKRGGDPADVEWVEVWMELEPGARASLMLHRAAYVGAGEERSAIPQQSDQHQTAS
jgi:2-polyprenyl-3-methyl-5-hydroxy-6-metoxy-1,4-benzoquinol methylase